MPLPWDVARAWCATKFNGCPYADLIELTGLKEEFAKDLLTIVNAKPGTF